MPMEGTRHLTRPTYRAIFSGSVQDIKDSNDHDPALRAVATSNKPF
jgi:hypothetical protein